MKHLRWALGCAVILFIIFMSGSFSLQTESARMMLVKSYVYAAASETAAKTGGDMTQYDERVFSVLFIRDTQTGGARHEITLAVFNTGENTVRLIAIPPLTRARVLGGGPVLETVGDALEGVTPEEGGQRAAEAVKALFGGVPISQFIFLRDSAIDAIAGAESPARPDQYGESATDYRLMHQGLLLISEVIQAMKQDGLAKTLDAHAQGGLVHNLSAEDVDRLAQALAALTDSPPSLSIMPGMDRMIDVRSFFMPDDILLKELILELYYKTV